MRQLSILLASYLCLTVQIATFTPTSNAELRAAAWEWAVNSSAASATYGDIAMWNVTKVTNMNRLFYQMSTFNANISAWDMSKVLDTSAMFWQARAFDQDLSRWDVSSVTNMARMFSETSAFNQELNIWNVSSVTSMYAMFYGAEAFNQDLRGWDVSSVTNMGHMFRGSAFNQDLSGWEVGSVTTMEVMFYEAKAFNGDLSRWDVSSVTNMGSMFGRAYAFNQELSGWDISSVTNMGNMFKYARAFNQDLSAWRPCSVETMNKMFCGINGNFITEHLPLLQETWPLYPPECNVSSRAAPSASEIEECRAGPSSSTSSSTSASSGMTSTVTTSSTSAPTSSSSSTTSSTGSTTSTTSTSLSTITSESSRTSISSGTTRSTTLKTSGTTRSSRTSATTSSSTGSTTSTSLSTVPSESSRTSTSSGTTTSSTSKTSGTTRSSRTSATSSSTGTTTSSTSTTSSVSAATPLASPMTTGTPAPGTTSTTSSTSASPVSTSLRSTSGSTSSSTSSSASAASTSGTSSTSSTASSAEAGQVSTGMSSLTSTARPSSESATLTSSGSAFTASASSTNDAFTFTTTTQSSSSSETSRTSTILTTVCSGEVREFVMLLQLDANVDLFVFVMEAVSSLATWLGLPGDCVDLSSLDDGGATRRLTSGVNVTEAQVLLTIRDQSSPSRTLPSYDVFEEQLCGSSNQTCRVLKVSEVLPDTKLWPVSSSTSASSLSWASSSSSTPSSSTTTSSTSATGLGQDISSASSATTGSTSSRRGTTTSSSSASSTSSRVSQRTTTTASVVACDDFSFYSFTLVLQGMAFTSANFTAATASQMAMLIADALGRSPSCITVQLGEFLADDNRRLRGEAMRRLSDEVNVSVTVPAHAQETSESIQAALENSTFESALCESFKANHDSCGVIGIFDADAPTTTALPSSSIASTDNPSDVLRTIILAVTCSGIALFLCTISVVCYCIVRPSRLGRALPWWSGSGATDPRGDPTPASRDPTWCGTAVRPPPSEPSTSAPSDGAGVMADIAPGSTMEGGTGSDIASVNHRIIDLALDELEKMIETAQKPVLGPSAKSRRQQELDQKEERKRNVERARELIVDPSVRSPTVCEKALELFWLEVQKGQSEIGPLALEQIGWLSRSHADVVDSDTCRSAFARMCELTKLHADPDQQASDYMRVALLKEVGKELRNVSVEVESFEKLDEGLLACHVSSNDYLDAEMLQFLEFLPVKVEVEGISMPSAVIELREYTYVSLEADVSIEQELLCQLPLNPPQFFQDMPSSTRVHSSGEVIRSINGQRQQETRKYLLAVYEQEMQRWPHVQDHEAMACIAACFSEYLNANVEVDLQRDALWHAAKDILAKAAGAGVGRLGHTLIASGGEHVVAALSALRSAVANRDPFAVRGD